MDAILVHVALMNIKAVGKERRAGLMRSSDQGSFGAISRRQTDVKGDSEKLASKRWNIPSMDNCNSENQPNDLFRREPASSR